MQGYTPFFDEVSEALTAFSASPPGANIEKAGWLLSGEASAGALRDLIPAAKLRSTGTYFTSSRLAERVWEDHLSTLDATSVVVDPACGAGDLLLPPLRELVEKWGGLGAASHIKGSDLESGFADVCRARLQLATALATGEVAAFHNVRQADFFDDPQGAVDSATHVVINPPFTLMDAPDECNWGNSGVNSAAVFVHLALKYMTPGARMIAILPDVLRSGSRYDSWRSQIAELGERGTVADLGQFDKSTDIHVFMLSISRAKHASLKSEIEWHRPPSSAADSVGDHFVVKIGSVVPHRDPMSGPAVPYVTSRSIDPWTTVNRVSLTAKVKGRRDRGPVVVVRRTSRPGEPHRARATIVNDEREIAFENHLVVVSPKDGTLETCKALLAVLRDQRTTTFLDERIRCRHLTVSSVREIPWLDNLERARNG